MNPGLRRLLTRRVRNLVFSTNVEKAIRDAQMIFISVNTPTKTYGVGKGMAADLKYVELCARQIAEVANEDIIIVEKSTLPVRTAQSIRRILAAYQNGHQFRVLSNPEFLAEGTAINDLHYADRVLIGSEEDEQGKCAEEALVDIYSNWLLFILIHIPLWLMPMQLRSLPSGMNLNSMIGKGFIRIC